MLIVHDGDEASNTDLVALAETLDNIRRLAERGLGEALKGNPSDAWRDEWAVDSFQSILDEVAVAKTYI